jgi:hypothetical protein
MRFRVPFLKAVARRYRLVRILVGLSVFYDIHAPFENPGHSSKVRHYRCSRQDCPGMWAYTKPPKYRTCPHSEPMEACDKASRKCRHQPPSSYR